MSIPEVRAVRAALDDIARAGGFRPDATIPRAAVTRLRDAVRDAVARNVSYANLSGITAAAGLDATPRALREFAETGRLPPSTTTPRALRPSPDGRPDRPPPAARPPRAPPPSAPKDPIAAALAAIDAASRALGAASRALHAARPAAGRASPAADGPPPPPELPPRRIPPPPEPSDVPRPRPWRPSPHGRRTGPR